MVLQDAVAALRAGRLVVHPTETVYGIGTALSAGDAGVERVRRAKSSPPGRPYLLIAADAEMAFSLWEEVPLRARELAAVAWPGPLTLVGPARAGLPSSLLGESPLGPTLAVRVPDDDWLLALLRELGEPIVSTSANPAGSAPKASFEELDLASLAPDLAVDRGTCPGGTPSTLVSLQTDPPTLLRPGAWPWPPPGAPSGRMP